MSTPSDEIAKNTIALLQRTIAGLEGDIHGNADIIHALVSAKVAIHALRLDLEREQAAKKRSREALEQDEPYFRTAGIPVVTHDAVKGTQVHFFNRETQQTFKGIFQEADVPKNWRPVVHDTDEEG